MVEVLSRDGIESRKKTATCHPRPKIKSRIFSTLSAEVLCADIDPLSRVKRLSSVPSDSMMVVYGRNSLEFSNRVTMNKKLLIVFFAMLSIGIVFLLIGKVRAQAIPPGHIELKIPMGDLERRCLVHLPPGHDKTTPVPLVIMLHGMGGTGANAMRETSWSTKADSEGFIVVYPEATRPNEDRPPSLRNNAQSWNDGSGRFNSAERNIDDVAFILEQLAPTQALSLCYLAGTADTLNPLDGGFPKLALGGKDQGGQPKPPVAATIEKWAKAVGCSEAVTEDAIENGVRTHRYGPGRESAEVVFITIEGLGHHWAGGVSQAPEFLVGKNSKKLKATDAIWNFFKLHLFKMKLNPK